MIFEEAILGNCGGLAKNNLNTVIEQYINTEDYIISLPISSYYSHDQIPTLLSKKVHRFTTLTLNCQSLNSKFDKLSLLIFDLKQHSFEFGALCLQETWLTDDADLSFFQIPNYICISQGKYCSNHGGLIIYLHLDYLYDPFIISFKSDLWEGMIIKILNNVNEKHIYLGNIYRPPRENYNTEAMETFINELNNFIRSVDKSKSVIILHGDFNIDLLKLRNKTTSKNFMEYMLSIGMLPQLTLPTRLAEHSASLIDNIFTNCTDNNIVNFSGILISDISDHLPSFFCMNNILKQTKPKKYLYCRKYNEETFHKLYSHLEATDILSKLNSDVSADPNSNYEIMENILLFWQ